MAARLARVAEVRAEDLLIGLLRDQGWDVRRPPAGELLRQHEYKDHPHLLDVLKGISKSGTGDGRPEAFLINRETMQPVAVIEVKAARADLEKAVKEVTDVYGRACIDAGMTPLAIALAGSDEDNFELRIMKWSGTRWQPVTYESEPISWIPNRADFERLLAPGGPREIRPSVPPPDVLAERADEINRLLRESGIKDELRPATVGAIMLALWQSKGQIRKDPDNILSDINLACEKAFWKAKKADLAKVIRVDEANESLAINARRIATILERLNVTVLTAEHDYLGHLYEEFFRYTGGNTIGQYFTPRHIAEFVAALLNVESADTVLDPACGTGGFLIAVMNRMFKYEHLSKAQVVKLVQKKLIGFDKEPITAALCVANMVLRGDGSTSVHRGDSFKSSEYPIGKATVVLSNPPFPHAKTDTPPERFIDRALEGLQHRGRLGIIIPRSMLNLPKQAKWREEVLKHNTLDGVIILPEDLFEPYASSYTAVLLMTKGVKHSPNHRVFFAHIENDGFKIKKGSKVPQPGEQLSAALRTFHARETVPGFCGWAMLNQEAGWDAGYYTPPRPLTEAEIDSATAELTRNGASFVVSHAPELLTLEQAVTAGGLPVLPYRSIKRFEPGEVSAPTIGGHFAIQYGQRELHSKERLGPGNALIISSSGLDNGCYGFFDFEGPLIEPPFVTVPSTGSIGMAHVQSWPCGVTDDCLILVPKTGSPPEAMYVAAAVIRNEAWRFNYGRKITPDRIANFPLPLTQAIIQRVAERLEGAKRVGQVALEIAEDDYDAKIARDRAAEIESSNLVEGEPLKQRLLRIVS